MKVITEGLGELAQNVYTPGLYSDVGSGDVFLVIPTPGELGVTLICLNDLDARKSTGFVGTGVILRRLKPGDRVTLEQE